MKNVINHTSVDEIRSSLYHVNPTTLKDTNEFIDYMKLSLKDELENQKRISVIKMLTAKLNQLVKMKAKFLGHA
jgi:hypothetical protein